MCRTSRRQASSPFSWPDSLGRAAHAARQEAPDGRVHGHHLVFKEETSDSHLEAVENDLDHVLELGELKDVAKDGGTSDEVSLQPGLPGDAAFNSVKSVFLVGRNFFVEDRHVLVPDGSEGAIQA